MLIKEEFPKKQGIQDTLFLQHFDQYESGISQFVQIIHVNGNHWLCVSNKFSPGTVDVYDCSPGNGISSLQRQVAVILNYLTFSFTMRQVEVQRQIGNADFGLFSIAFAYSLCYGVDPHTIHFNQCSMRAHFDSCVDKEKIDTFPTSCRSLRQITKNRIKSVKVVHVLCTCRLPRDKANTESGPMVKCLQCKDWYHSKCDNIDLKIYVQHQILLLPQISVTITIRT